ncbi:MAG: insulinase family protein [Actinobacteria bacterium]|nr:insulinase family protein [Actinomycetota bacterium]
MIRTSSLDSGLRVVTEAMPGLRSVAVGFWVGTGSRDETDPMAGASHFLEHLLFKGTQRRGAAEIAEAVESVGGDMNAFTGQELTAFYVRMPDQRLPLAVDILSDIVWSPALRPADVDSERQVILEEIRMRDDTPDDLVHDLFASAMFPDHPIGREITGSPATIEPMARDAIAEFHAAHYHPGNVVVAVAGNVDHDEVVRLVEDGMRGVAGDRPARLAHDGEPGPKPIALVEDDTEQVHLVLGMRAMRRDDPDRYAFGVVNQVLGGGMSSRLFQEVREQRGLAYSVYSYRAAFEETGAFGIYAGTAPERVDELLDVLDGQLARLQADGGVSERELESAKGHLTGSMALGLESSISRMNRIGRSELLMGEIPSLDELVRACEAVTATDVERVVDRIFRDNPRTVAAVGPVTEAVLARAV